MVFILKFLTGAILASSSQATTLTPQNSCVPQAISLVKAHFITLEKLRANDTPTQISFETRKLPSAFRAEDIERNVHPFTEEELAKTRLYAMDGILYTAEGKPFDTGKELYLYYLDKSGNLYSHREVTSETGGKSIRHSSFGDQVAGAGKIGCKHGVVNHLDTDTGHFTTRKRHLLQTQSRLQEMGVPVSEDQLFIRKRALPMNVPIDYTQIKTRDHFVKAVNETDPEDWGPLIRWATQQHSPTLASIAFFTLSNSDSLSPKEVTELIHLGMKRPEAMVIDAVAVAVREGSRRPEVDLISEAETLLFHPRADRGARINAAEALSLTPLSEKALTAIERAVLNEEAQEPAALGVLAQGLFKYRNDARFQAHADSLLQRTIARLNVQKGSLIRDFQQDAKTAVQDLERLGVFEYLDSKIPRSLLNRR